MTASIERRASDIRSGKHDRCDRYFCLDSQWYFTTREGLTMGPYESQEQAVDETNLYIEFVRSAAQPVVTMLKRRTAKL